MGPLQALTICPVTPSRFIQPCSPVLAKAVPLGYDWLHEVKFDGYRIQAHKRGKDVVIFSRNGHDFTARFLPIAIMLTKLPARSAVLDGEIVASDAAGRPDFGALHRRRSAGSDMTLWLFDLLALNGRDLREQPLHKRQARLRALVHDLDCPAVLASESFDDGEALMRATERYGLEGVVSKRRDMWPMPASLRTMPTTTWTLCASREPTRAIARWRPRNWRWQFCTERPRGCFWMGTAKLEASDGAGRSEVS